MKRSSSMVLFLTICSFTKARGGVHEYDEKSAITSVLSPESKDRPDCCINSYVLVRETPLYKGYFAH